jgi:hypothetical protein
MKIFKVAFRRIAFLIAVLAAAGCGGNANNAVMPLAATSAANPDIKITKDWLFVSDPDKAEVFIYTLPQLRLVEIVTGFTQPQGECSDDKGDVWVTDGSAKTIYKLLHSGKIVQKLSDGYGVPYGCAWDAKTGNLAVLNLIGGNSQGGAVLVFHHAAGVPNVYDNPKQFYYNFGGYDSAGNLFFDGSTVGGKFVLSELPVNATRAKTVTVAGGKIYSGGMVQWDAASHELVVGDQKCDKVSVSCLYRMTIAGYAATIRGQTLLQNGSGSGICDMIQGVLWNKSVVGSDFDSCGSASSATYVWPYPKGGQPSHANPHNVSEPFGAAISIRSSESPRSQQEAQAIVSDGIAKKVDLLYISDGNGEVTVYTYWQKTLVRVLTGFARPMGECVDKADDVFITDYAAKQIVEYAHDGERPIAKLDDSPYAPYACSVDLTSGSLAVANEAGNASQGNIAVYTDARGMPKVYTDATISDFQACAYDNDGNLLASNGEAGTRTSYFAWLPKGGGKLLNVNIPGPLQSWTWESVNGIQWDGRYYVIDADELYRVSVLNGQGYYIGQTYLQVDGATGPFWIYNIHLKKQGTQVVGPYNDFSYGSVDYWNYPSGGDAIAQISKGLDNPVAVTVSLGKIHE